MNLHALIVKFLLLAAERLFLGRLLERLPRVLRHAYALFFILIGWVFFAHTDMTDALVYLGTMLGVYGPTVAAGELYTLSRNLLPLGIMLLGCTPIPKRLFWRFVGHSTSLPLSRRIAVTIVALFTLVLSTAYLADASYNPFLYFRF